METEVFNANDGPCKTACSYTYFGDIQIEQPFFHCTRCDPFNIKKLCFHCISVCHQACMLKPSKHSQSAAFICCCASIFNHSTKKIDGKPPACNKRKFDELIGNMQSYSCGNHISGDNMMICSICYAECHFNCKKNDVIRGNEESYECKCQIEANYDVSELSIFYHNTIQDYIATSKIPLWPIHVINVLFSGNYPHLLKEASETIIHSMRPSRLLKSNIRLLSRTFRNQFKTFYYGEKIINEMFPREKFLKYCSNRKHTTGIQHLITLELFYIFFFLYIKRDFNYLKSYTTSDFLFHSNFLRLEQRKYMMSKNIYTQEFLTYYKDNKDFFLDKILPFMAHVTNENENENEDLTEFYEDFLKILAFMLKRMFFEKEELKKIVNHLVPLYDKIYLYLDVNLKQLIDRLPKAWRLVPIFVKVFYLIALNYNDFVFQEYIDLYQHGISTQRRICFLHSKEQEGTGKKLLGMVLRNCQLLSIYKRYPDANYGKVEASMKLIVDISNETLKVFSVVDNAFLSKSLESSQEELEKHTERCQYYVRASTMKVTAIDQGIYDLKCRIEGYMQLYCTSIPLKERGIKISEPVESITQCFSQHMRHLLNGVEETQRPNWELKLYDAFKNLRKQKGKIEMLIDSLIFSNLDETLTKFLMFFTNADNDSDYNTNTSSLTSDHINVILSHLLLFFSNKRGMKYFLTGKNLSRIIKVFQCQLQCQINEDNEKCVRLLLEFLHIIFKRISYHDQPLLFKSKYLFRLSNVFLMYVKKYLSKFFEYGRYQIKLKIHISLLFKIVTSLNEHFASDQYRVLQRALFIRFISGGYIYSINDFAKYLIESAERERKMNIHSINSTDQVSVKEPCCGKFYDDEGNLLEERVHLRLFFSFFYFISKNQYYFDKDFEKWFNYLSNLDLKLLMKMLSTEDLCLKHRRILLNSCRTIFFMDKINKIDYNTREKYLSVHDYEKYACYVHNNFISENAPQLSRYTKSDIDEATFAELKRKKLFVDKLCDVIILFTREIDSFYKRKFPISVDYMNKYMRDLIVSVQFFRDFFYIEKDIWPFIQNCFQPLIISFVHQSAHIAEEYLHRVLQSKSSPCIKLLQNEMESLIKETDLSNIESSLLLLSECLGKVYKITGINQTFSISYFMRTYDKRVELNFSSFALVKTKDYEYFYEEDEKPSIESIISQIRTQYEEQFNSFDQTYFMTLLADNNVGNEVFDYQQYLINYFIANAKSDKTLKSYSTWESLLYIMTKILYYSSALTTTKFNFISNDDIEIILRNFKNILRRNIVHSIVLAKNHFVGLKVFQLTNYTKMVLEILRLVMDTKFQNGIFGLEEEGDDSNNFLTPLPEETSQLNAKLIKVKHLRPTFYEEPPQDTFGFSHKDESIFGIVHSTLLSCYSLLDLERPVNYDMPFDELIVLLTNCVSFFNECFHISNPAIKEKVFESMKDFLYHRMFDCIYYKLIKSNFTDKYKTRKRILAYVKLQVLNLLIYYLQGGKGDDQKEAMVKKLFKFFSPSRLFEEIVVNFEDLLEEFTCLPSPTVSNTSFLEKLETAYVFNEDFREALQLKVCFKLFTLIKIFENDYSIYSLRQYFDNILAEELKKKSRGFFYKKNSGLRHKIYLFLNQMVIQVEVQKSEEAEAESEKKRQVIYFIRPHLTFHLSNQSNWDFENYVDRKNANTKLNALISYSDILMFEMVYIMKFFKQGGLYYNLYKKINLYYLHLANYLFTIVHNILLIAMYYRPSGGDLNNYEDELVPDRYIAGNYWLGVAQAIFLVIFIYLSTLYNNLSIQEIIMKYYHHNFLLRTVKGQIVVPITVREYFKNTLTNPENDLPCHEKVKVWIWAFLAYSKTSVFLLTLALLLVFFATWHPMWIVLPIVFVMYVSPTLKNILKVVQLRWWQLITVLLFTYTCVYIFMWLAIFYMSDNIGLTATEIESGEEITERFCVSTVQCLLMMIDAGVRDGISGENPIVSYKNNRDYFLMRFFFVLLFQIIIIQIMSNVFLGIIVDTFADLRDENQKKEEDMMNKCFICQMTRDQSLMKSIDFNEHVKEQHNMWNYIYFLTYLHIGNPNEFNFWEAYVWEKLGNQDISWIPLETSDDNN